MLRRARQAGVPVIGELGFAASFISEPMIAITGTNGKSTVTSFLAQLAKEAGLEVFAGGNLGNPLSEAVLSETRFDLLVVEVSSYQMENPGLFHPHAAVVLNLTPDHLARHGDMETYGRTKCRVFAEMTDSDTAILPANNEALRSAARDTGGQRLWMGDFPGVRLQNGSARMVLQNGREGSLNFDDLRVPGSHNRENAAVAALLLYSLGISLDGLQRGIGKLQGLPHRMEIICELGGVCWINDSKATNVAATEAALRGIRMPAVLLLGGQAKAGAAFADLAPLLTGQRAVVTFGASGMVIADALEARGLEPIRCLTMQEAVEAASERARQGDAILLSPGCASFDEFRNFEHRGEAFGSICRDLTMDGVSV
jgi:UDP-N-acetylmuramoylalanine--D-glutamate ligase